MNNILTTLNALTVQNLNLLCNQTLRLSKKSIKKSDIIYDIYKYLLINSTNISLIDNFIKENRINLSYNKNLFFIINNTSKQDLFIYINNFDFENTFSYYINTILQYKWKLIEQGNGNKINFIFILSNYIKELTHSTNTFIDTLKKTLLNDNVYIILMNTIITNTIILKYINESNKVFYIYQNDMFTLNSISNSLNNFYTFNKLSKTLPFNIHFDFNLESNNKICKLKNELTFCDIIMNKKLSTKQIALITYKDNNILISETDIQRKIIQIISESKKINEKINNLTEQEKKIERIIYYYGNDIKIQNEKLIKIEYQSPLLKFKSKLIEGINTNFKSKENIYLCIGKNDKLIFNLLNKIKQIYPKYELDYKTEKFVLDILKDETNKKKLISYIEKQYNILSNSLEIQKINIYNYKEISGEFKIKYDEKLSIDILDAIILGLYGYNKSHNKFNKKNYITSNINQNDIIKIIVHIKFNDKYYQIIRSFYPTIKLDILENNNIIQSPDDWISNNLISVSTFINFYTITKSINKSFNMNTILFDKYFTVDIKNTKKEILNIPELIEEDVNKTKSLNTSIKKYINILVLNSIYEETKNILISDYTSSGLQNNISYNEEWLYNGIPIINVPANKFYDIHLSIIKFYNKFIKTTQIFTDYKYNNNKFIEFV